MHGARLFHRLGLELCSEHRRLDCAVGLCMEDVEEERSGRLSCYISTERRDGRPILLSLDGIA